MGAKINFGAQGATIKAKLNTETGLHYCRLQSNGLRDLQIHNLNIVQGTQGSADFKLNRPILQISELKLKAPIDIVKN